jgi:hypothetical protein
MQGFEQLLVLQKPLAKKTSDTQGALTPWHQYFSKHDAVARPAHQVPERNARLRQRNCVYEAV